MTRAHLSLSYHLLVAKARRIRTRADTEAGPFKKELRVGGDRALQEMS